MSQELQGCPRLQAYLDCGNADCRGVIKVNSIPTQSNPRPTRKAHNVILGYNMSYVEGFHNSQAAHFTQDMW